jgi:tetratricopeptide (TPR) repeat protein
MNAKPRAKRPDLALPGAALVASFILLMVADARAAQNEVMDYGYERAALLSSQKKHGEALVVLTEGLRQAEENRDIRLAFFLARNLSSCHEKLDNLTACLEMAERAISHLDALDELNPPSMSATTRAYERTLLTGLIAKHHLQGNRMALARHWHNREGDALRRMFALLGTPDLDLKGGQVPRKFIWAKGKPNRSQIARYLWMGSWLLEKEARTSEALANLEAAERYLSNLDKSPYEVETDYHYKISNRKAMLLDFLGYDQEAIAIQRETAAEPLVEDHAKSVLIDRLNLQVGLAKYYGPSETYLQAALEAYQALKELSPTGEAPDAQRQIHKMVFDLRHDPGVTADMEALEKKFKDSGFELEGDYSEVDQIEIALRLGKTEGLEARLIASLEKFRDVGNRKGVPSLYHTYGNLLMMLGRPGEAIYMYQETLKLSLAYGWIVHVPDIMLKLTEAHLALGDTAGAAAWLEKARKHIQSNPGIPAHRIASARALMVELLRKMNRGAEADALRDETLAFAKSNAVPDHHIRRLLNEDTGGKDARDAVAAADKESAGGIDFQPLRVVSEVAPGETAHARFTLANPTGDHAAGKLTLPPGIELVSWDSEAGDMRLRTSTGTQSGRMIPVEFGPSEMIRICLESGDVRGGTPREFSFAWNGPGAADQTSLWSVSAADSRSELTVVNANLIRHNPFYLVPLYHAVRARDVGEPLRDFRVICSIPCYVEMIDADTGRVIAVDRHGDGGFRETGDIVYQDENRDLYPDHRFRQAGELYGLELRVFPADESARTERPEEYSISIEARVNGSWETLAKNRVLMSN